VHQKVEVIFHGVSPQSLKSKALDSNQNVNLETHTVLKFKTILVTLKKIKHQG